MADEIAKVNLALGVESVFGTAVSPSAYLEVSENGLKLDKDVQRVEDTSGTRKGALKAVTGAAKVSGSIKANAYPTAMGWWLKGALGTVASGLASGETAVYTHYITVADTLPSFTLIQDRGNSEWQKVTSAVINGFKISAKNGLVEVEINIEAKDETAGTTYTATQTIEKPFMFHQVKVGFGATIGAARTAAATGTSLMEWTAEYDNGLEVLHASGSATPVKIVPKTASFKTTFTQVFDSITNRDRYRNLTKTAMCIDLVGDAIGAASFNTLRIEIPNAIINSHEVPYKAGDIMFEKVEAVGLYEPGENNMIRCILTNTKSVYTS